MEYSGFIIKKERLARNWSQEGLCKGICAVSYLSKIEKGKTEASKEILRLLFERLGIKWVLDEKAILKAKEFVEEWYEELFSYDFKKISEFSEKAEKEFPDFEKSPLAIDFMLLKSFSREEIPLDEKFEPYMDPRKLALQKICEKKFLESASLFPCAFTFFRTGAELYEKGDYSAALEHLQKAYDLGAAEGRARLMMASKLFISNCYSNIKDVEAMERHGKIAKRLALELGEINFAKSVDYNFAATKIETGEYEKAYDYFSKIENPSAFSLHKLAVCCEKLGKKDEALKALEKEKTAFEETESYKELADKASELVLFRIEHEDYLSRQEYGEMLLLFFKNCRKNFPAGYARFHIPWVIEWYTANRQYKQAFELLNEFS